MPDGARLEAEQELYVFRERHDLSRGLAGATPRPLWIIKEGCLAWVSGPDRAAMLPVADVLAGLTELGDAIAARLPGSALAMEWGDRERLAAQDLVSIETRLSPEILEELGLSHTNELPPTPELRAAARMVGAWAPRSVTRAILDEVSRVPLGDRTKLDQLTDRVLAQLSIFDGSIPPHTQGYKLARWLRDHRHEGNRPVHPAAVLGDLGVTVREIELDTRRVDAVACWGPNHGPAVIVNVKGRCSSSGRARRATLAHELCHLLVDRSRALPFAEVFGGQVPRRPEKRAGAFAAEYLLPRAVAGERMAKSNTPRGTLNHLCKQYTVSSQLAALQALGADRQFTPEVHEYLYARAYP